MARKAMTEDARNELIGRLRQENKKLNAGWADTLRQNAGLDNELRQVRAELETANRTYKTIEKGFADERRTSDSLRMKIQELERDVLKLTQAIGVIAKR